MSNSGWQSHACYPVNPFWCDFFGGGGSIFLLFLRRFREWTSIRHGLYKGTGSLVRDFKRFSLIPPPAGYSFTVWDRDALFPSLEFHFTKTSNWAFGPRDDWPWVVDTADSFGPCAACCQCTPDLCPSPALDDGRAIPSPFVHTSPRTVSTPGISQESGVWNGVCVSWST